MTPLLCNAIIYEQCKYYCVSRMHELLRNKIKITNLNKEYRFFYTCKGQIYYYFLNAAYASVFLKKTSFNYLTKATLWIKTLFNLESTPKSIIVSQILHFNLKECLKLLQVTVSILLQNSIGLVDFKQNQYQSMSRLQSGVT